VDCYECTEAHADVILGSLLVSWGYVILQHVLAQGTFGTFDTFTFFIQIASFVLFPESISPIIHPLTRNLLMSGSFIIWPHNR
jgi:hypothetical protein